MNSVAIVHVSFYNFQTKKPQLRALLKLNYWWMKIFNSFGLIVTKTPVSQSGPVWVRFQLAQNITSKVKQSMWSGGVSENLISFNLVEFEFVIYSVLIAAWMIYDTIPT